VEQSKYAEVVGRVRNGSDHDGVALFVCPFPVSVSGLVTGCGSSAIFPTEGKDAPMALSTSSVIDSLNFI